MPFTPRSGVHVGASGRSTNVVGRHPGRAPCCLPRSNQYHLGPRPAFPVPTGQREGSVSRTEERSHGGHSAAKSRIQSSDPSGSACHERLSNRKQCGERFWERIVRGNYRDLPVPHVWFQGNGQYAHSGEKNPESADESRENHQECRLGDGDFGFPGDDFVCLAERASLWRF